MKRYYPFSRFLKEHFGHPVFKVVVDAGFTCPNRDGRRGSDGCSFCNNEAFSPAVAMNDKSITGQIESGMERIKRRRKKAHAFLAYFQAYSNTYAPVEKLRLFYEEALKVPGVVGLAVGTRPDCLPDEVIKLISEMAQKTHFWLELGLETSHNSTLKAINRGHSYEEFLDSYEKVRAIPNLHICLHLIHGLPGETEAMMLDTVREVNRLKPEAVKFHQLEIVKGTVMEGQYKRGEISLLSLEEYIKILGDSLRLLNSDIVVQRLFGFTPSEYLIAPEIKEHRNYHQLIENYLAEKNIFQGEKNV